MPWPWQSCRCPRTARSRPPGHRTHCAAAAATGPSSATGALENTEIRCPTCRTRPPAPASSPYGRGSDAPPSPSWPAGLRDRTLLLVGFFAALRRAELAALTVEQISTHDRGLVLACPGPRPTNTVTRPSSSCPAAAPPRTARSPPCRSGVSTTTITDGLVLRKISRGNRALPHSLHPNRQRPGPNRGRPRRAAGRPVLRAQPAGRACHLRASARRLGSGDRAPTRHRSLATLGMYVRVHEASEDNASTMPGL